MPESPTILTAMLNYLPHALLHTLWQGAIIAGIVFIALHSMPARHANIRYGVAVAGLFGVVFSGLLTWCIFGLPDFQELTLNTAVQQQSGTSIAGVSSDTVNIAANPDHITATVPLLTEKPSFAKSLTLLYCWLAGVLIMLLRIVYLSYGTQQLRRSCCALDNDLIIAMTRELKSLLGITRQVTVLVADHLFSPVAMGMFWPTVLIPATMATSLPPQQIRAILAHELAHIRRYDYLVNFMQLVIETLMYFNPAVWWISRQIRIEREACCDALAARILGDTADYADTLSQIARHIKMGAMLAALSQNLTGQSSLLERLRRLLLPDYRPHLRLHWYSIAAGIFMTLAILSGLFGGSALSVVLANKMFPDEERIAVMTKLAEKYAPIVGHDFATEEYMDVFVKITTCDGSPLPKGNRSQHIHTNYKNGSFNASLSPEGEYFHARVPKGKHHITAEFPGYAPAMLGPISENTEEVLGNLELCLAPSHPVTLRFINPEGKPVPDVRFNGYYEYSGNGGSLSLQDTSDDTGCIQLEQAAKPFSICFSAKVDGYQEVTREHLLIEPDTTFEWTLQPDTPIQGLVVDKSTNEPIHGAVIQLIGTKCGNSISPQNNYKTAASTNRTGTFELDGLAGQCRYYYIVRKPRYGAEVFSVDQGQTNPVDIHLHQRYIHGTIRGDLSLLNQGKRRHGSVITYIQYISAMERFIQYPETDREIPVTINGDEATFSIDTLATGMLYIAAGAESIGLDIQDSVDDFVITLESPENKLTRKMIIELPVPEGAPPAQGKLSIVTFNGQRNGIGKTTYIDIADGGAEINLTVPASVKIEAVELNGYIPKPLNEEAYSNQYITIDEGVEAATIQFPLDRGGTVYGQVLRPDGAPVTNVRVAARVLSNNWPFQYRCSTTSNIWTDEQGNFAFLPLPLEEEIVLSATKDMARTQERLVLNLANSIANVQMILPEGISVPIKVIGPDDQPLANIPLIIADADNTYVNGQATTNINGMYLCSGLDPSKEYNVEARPFATYQYAGIQFRPMENQEITLKLKNGIGVKGVVIMSDTDAPVVGCSVKVRLHHPSPNSLNLREYRLNATTDSEGNFKFLNLCEGKFKLDVSSNTLPLRLEGSDLLGSITFTAGQDNSVIVKVLNHSRK